MFSLRPILAATLAKAVSEQEVGVKVEMCDLLTKDGEVIGEVHATVTAHVRYPAMSTVPAAPAEAASLFESLRANIEANWKYVRAVLEEIRLRVLIVDFGAVCGSFSFFSNL